MVIEQGRPEQTISFARRSGEVTQRAIFGAIVAGTLILLLVKLLPIAPARLAYQGTNAAIAKGAMLSTPSSASRTGYPFVVAAAPLVAPDAYLQRLCAQHMRLGQDSTNILVSNVRPFLERERHGR